MLRIIHLALIGKDEKMQNFAISLLGVMVSFHFPFHALQSLYCDKFFNFRPVNAKISIQC